MVTLCVRINTTIAAEPAGVGVVVAYTPDSATLSMQRDSAASSVPVRIGTVVDAGDRISLPANSTVTIELSDSRQIVSSGPGVWSVPSAPPMGLITSIFHRFEFSINPNDVRIVTAITKSAASCSRSNAQPIAMPSLGSDAHIRPGHRGLSLAWTGGCPPFNVELQSVHRKLVAQREVNASELRFDDLNVSPGRYWIAIEGAGGSRARFSFTALDAAPTLPHELLEDTSHLGTIAGALWLATEDKGNWRLDAVELLAVPAREGDPLAAYELRRLLWSRAY